MTQVLFWQWGHSGRLSNLGHQQPPFSPDTPPELLPPDLGGRTAFLCFLFFVLEAV